MKRFLCLNLSLLFAFIIYGQRTPDGLRLTIVQNKILQKMVLFDSAAFFDLSGFWSDEMKMKGYGFKNDIIYETTISFAPDTGSFSDMKVLSMTTKRVDSTLLKKIRSIPFSEIIAFDDSSLDSPGGHGGDFPYSTIVIIKNNMFAYKQSYYPEGQQYSKPTPDRGKFIEIFGRYWNLLHPTTNK
jgi:hypothetical protein